MKKYLVFIFVILLLFITACNTEKKYDEWKDSHNVYGDGTYVSYHSTRDGKNVFGINNTVCKQSVVEEILAEKTYDKKVYIYGMFYPYEVYMVIDTNNNKAKYYPKMSEDDVLGMTNINDLISSGTFELLQSYNDFSDEEKAILDSLNDK